MQKVNREEVRRILYLKWWGLESTEVAPQSKRRDKIGYQSFYFPTNGLAPSQYIITSLFSVFCLLTLFRGEPKDGSPSNLNRKINGLSMYISKEKDIRTRILNFDQINE